MPDFDGLLARLKGLSAELQQAAGGGQPVADVFLRLQGLTAEMRSAAEEAKEDLRKQAQALAAEARAKAEAMRQAREAPAPAPPPARPWEDHQGLGDVQIQALVESVVRLARAASHAH